MKLKGPAVVQFGVWTDNPGAVIMGLADLVGFGESDTFNVGVEIIGDDYMCIRCPTTFDGDMTRMLLQQMEII